MIYGIYQSAAGLQLNQYRQEVLANNLANVDTAGFKRDLAVVRERPNALAEGAGRPDWSNPDLSGLTGGSYVAPTYTSFAQGPIKYTGGKLDVAIQGDGFLAVQDGEHTRYTRDGRLLVNDKHELITAGGHKVLGTNNAPIVIPDGADGPVTVNSGGQVRVGSLEVGQLDLVDFENKQQLRKVGRNLFDAGEATATDAKAGLQPGFIEDSTVEPTAAMVSMIEISRAYEQNATLVGLADSTLARAVNDIARLQ